MRSEFLTNLLQIDTELQGHHFKLPVLYRDASSVTAVYPAKLPAVARLLPHRDLHPLALVPRVASVAITFFEYRDTDIGPYNEMAISIPCVYGERPIPLWSLARDVRHKTMHAFVLQLPVTTEIARLGGVELYGFPKFLADIDFDAASSGFRGALRVDGRQVLALSGPLPGAAFNEEHSRFITYSMRQGRLMEGHVVLNADAVGRSPGGLGMQLELDESHTMGRQLSEVLLRRRPLRVEYTPRFRSILHAPSCLE